MAPPPSPPKNSTRPDLPPSSSVRGVEPELRDDADTVATEEISVRSITSIDREAIARKEQEATSRLELLTGSIATAQEVLGSIEKEAKLKADSIAAAEKREEERRIKEITFADAATVLQAASRRMIARRNYAATKAAIILQAASRRMIARRNYAAIKAQRIFASAACIQSLARGFIARRRVKAQIAAQHNFASAACIQSLARGVIARRRIRAQISSIVIVQAYARGLIIRNKKKAAEAAIIPLQAIVRGHIDRKRVKVIKWYLAKSLKSKSFASFAPKGDNATKDMVHPSDSNDDSTVTFNDYDYDDEYNFEGCKPTMDNNGFDIDPKGFAKDLRNFVEEQGIASAFMSFFA